MHCPIGRQQTTTYKIYADVAVYRLNFHDLCEKNQSSFRFDDLSIRF